MMRTNCATGTRSAGLLMNLFLIGLLSGCGSNPPKVVTVHDTIELWRDRYVSPPPEMIEPVPIVELPNPVTAIDLKIGFLEQREAAKLCNGQLAEIGALGETK